MEEKADAHETVKLVICRSVRICHELPAAHRYVDIFQESVTKVLLDVTPEEKEWVIRITSRSKQYHNYLFYILCKYPHCNPSPDFSPV